MLGLEAYFALYDDKPMMSHRLGNNTTNLSQWMEEDEAYHAEVMKALEDDEDNWKFPQELYTGWLPAIRRCINSTSSFKS